MILYLERLTDEFKKVSPVQPKTFEFNEKFKNIAEEILKKYPEKNKKSAVMPFLYLAQKQNDNWIPLQQLNIFQNIYQCRT